MLSRFAVAVLMCWTLGAPALLGATQDLDQEQEVLPLPVLLDAELALGASRVHRVRAVHAGLVTLSLESFDFNPSFDILDADGSAVLGDTDSGLMFNARRVVQVEAGERFDVRVQSENALGGTYRLDIQHGEVPLPTGRTARRAEAELYAAYGHQSRSTADGDPQKRSTSLQWFLAAANVEFELQRSGRAKRLLEIVIPWRMSWGIRAVASWAGSCSAGPTIASGMGRQPWSCSNRCCRSLRATLSWRASREATWVRPMRASVGLPKVGSCCTSSCNSPRTKGTS